MGSRYCRACHEFCFGVSARASVCFFGPHECCLEASALVCLISLSQADRCSEALLAMAFIHLSQTSSCKKAHRMCPILCFCSLRCLLGTLVCGLLIAVSLLRQRFQRVPAFIAFATGAPAHASSLPIHARHQFQSSEWTHKRRGHHRKCLQPPCVLNAPELSGLQVLDLSITGSTC